MPNDTSPLAEFAARAVGEYMRACPDDPQVIRLRAQLDQLWATMTNAWRWN